MNIDMLIISSFDKQLYKSLSVSMIDKIQNFAIIDEYFNLFYYF